MSLADHIGFNIGRTILGLDLSAACASTVLNDSFISVPTLSTHTPHR